MYKFVQILGDFTTSVKRALQEIDPDYMHLPGLVVCGTHNPKLDDIELFLHEIKIARVSGLPALLICFGHQLGMIEYARNVLGIKDATSEEFGTGTLVVKKRADGLKVGLHDGETYWNNYEVVPEYLAKWKQSDSCFSTQFHPEYQSSKDDPHPLLVTFLQYAREMAS